MMALLYSSTPLNEIRAQARSPKKQEKGDKEHA
jgi:hypothetical protein